MDKIPYNSKDTISKYLGNVFTNEFLETFGIKTCKIKEKINVEIPKIEIKNSTIQLWRCFEMTDVFEIVRQRGRKEGIQESKKEIVKKLFKIGLPIEQIQEVTNLSKEEIQNFIKNNESNIA